jgi:hypothetical protein
MAEKIFEGVIQVGLDAATVKQQLKSLEGDVKGGFANIQSAASSAFGVIGAGLGVGLSVAGVKAAISGLVDLAKHAADYADSIGKAAQITGVGTEALSAWRHGAELADVSTEELETGLTKLSRAIADAASGNKEAVATFKSLGISVKDSAGQLKPTEAILGDIAERFERMPDGALKTDAALTLLGKGGARLIPLFNGGRKAIAEFTEEAQRMGLIVTTEAAKAAEQFNDNLTRMNKSIDGMKIAIGNGLIPAIVELLDLFAKLGGVKLEGIEERGLQRQIKTLKEIQSLSTKPGDDAFNFYSDKIAEAEIKLDSFQKKVEKPVTKTARVVVDTKSVDKAKNEVDSFLDGLDKQLATLENKKIELKLGPDAALGAGLDAQFAQFKEKLRAQQLPIPKGLDVFFEALKVKILGANDELKRTQFELGKLDELGKQFDQDSQEWGRATEEMAKHATEALVKLEPAFRELQKQMAIDILPEDKQGAARAGQEFEERIKVINEWRDAAIRAGQDVADVNAQAAQATADAWVTSYDKVKDKADETSEFIRTAFERGFDAVSDAIEGFLNDGFTSFEDFGKKTLRVINKLLADQITLQLKDSILGPDFGKKGAGIGGLLGGIFGKKEESKQLPGTTPADIADQERGQEIRDAAAATAAGTDQAAIAGVEAASAAATTSIEALSSTAQATISTAAATAEAGIQTTGSVATTGIEAVKAAALAAIQAASAAGGGGDPISGQAESGNGGFNFLNFFMKSFGPSKGGGPTDAGPASEGGGITSPGTFNYHSGGEITADGRNASFKSLMKFHSGGEVPIMAQSGEFMMRRSAVSRITVPTLQRMNETGTIPQDQLVSRSSRGAGGGGDRAPQITINAYDAPSFHKSKRQVAHEMRAALRRLD